MPRLDPPIELERKESESYLRLIQEINMADRLEITEEMFDAAKILWEDAGVQESYRRSNEYPLIDCAK